MRGRPGGKRAVASRAPTARCPPEVDALEDPMYHPLHFLVEERKQCPLGIPIRPCSSPRIGPSFTKQRGEGIPERSRLWRGYARPTGPPSTATSADLAIPRRTRVLFCFLGGDGPPLSTELPLAYDGSDHGNMIYTFDESGHVSWRKPQNCSVTSEDAYVRKHKNHIESCDECKGLSPEPRVVLPDSSSSEPDGPGKIK